MTTAQSAPGLSPRQILTMWWPLAASWLLMGIEGPTHSAISARLPQPEINLAAWGGIVFPICLIIEAPIIMLLAASTARSRDWANYRQLRRFTHGLGAALTAVHLLVAFTPLYYIVVRRLMGAPEAIIEPARGGLMLMVPWTWAIAYRRLEQGVLIRFGYSRAVGLGTVVRLCTFGTVLTLGYLQGRLPGVIVASAAVASGVTAEAIYAGLRARPVIRCRLRPTQGAGGTPPFGAFLAFYVPLAFTSILNLLVPPIASATLARMPAALASLAVWPALTGLIFILRSPGIAYNEVIVALLARPRAVLALRRFAIGLSLGVTLLFLLLTATPLSDFWFATLSGLPAHLATLGQRAFWFAALIPGVAVLQSWYQGLIVHSERTGGITEAVALYLVAVSLILGGGVLWGGVEGALVGTFALSFAGALQTAWLWHRSRSALHTAQQGEAVP